jgi:hypothetical protein
MHVIPAKAGIQYYLEIFFLDPRFRGDDKINERKQNNEGLMKMIKTMFLFLMAFFISSCACQGIKDPTIRHASAKKLPNPFYVYVKDNVVINHPAPGYEKRLLPTDSSFSHVGCYIACYSHDPNGAIYGVGQGIYVKGQVRVSGLYLGRVCYPQGYFHKDISKEATFKEICAKRIHTCGNNCWAGGDTGGWYGIQ